MFQTEKDLVFCIKQAVTAKGPSLLKGDRQSVFVELDLGYGIADMVIVGHKEKYPQRKNFLAYFDISLLSLIEKEEAISLKDIVYITKSPEKKVNSSLSSLMEEGFVVYREGKYFSDKKYSDVLTDSLAIEAKLKDWRRALKQAYRYKWFANKSFVFLPLENIAIPKANIYLFQQYNVGLAAVSIDKGIEVIFEPVKENPISNNMRIALNEHLLLQRGV